MTLPPEILGAVIAGLIAWGGVSVQLRWHRADIDRAQRTADGAHRRIDSIPGAAGRRAIPGG